VQEVDADAIEQEPSEGLVVGPVGPRAGDDHRHLTAVREQVGREAREDRVEVACAKPPRLGRHALGRRAVDLAIRRIGDDAVELTRRLEQPACRVLDEVCVANLEGRRAARRGRRRSAVLERRRQGREEVLVELEGRHVQLERRTLVDDARDDRSGQRPDAGAGVEQPEAPGGGQLDEPREKVRRRRRREELPMLGSMLRAELRRNLLSPGLDASEQFVRRLRHRLSMPPPSEGAADVDLRIAAASGRARAFCIARPATRRYARGLAGLPTILIPVGAFLAALGLLHATGRWRPARPAWNLERRVAAAKRPPASRFLLAWLLFGAAMLVWSATAQPFVWCPPLLVAGVLLFHTGLGVVRNKDGWADTLRRDEYAHAPIAEPSARQHAVSTGGITMLMGAILVAAAIANVIVGP
jgi:hypothetical protein